MRHRFDRAEPRFSYAVYRVIPTSTDLRVRSLAVISDSGRAASVSPDVLVVFSRPEVTMSEEDLAGCAYFGACRISRACVTDLYNLRILEPIFKESNGLCQILDEFAILPSRCTRARDSTKPSKSATDKRERPAGRDFATDMM